MRQVYFLCGRLKRLQYRPTAFARLSVPNAVLTGKGNRRRKPNLAWTFPKMC